MVSLLAILLYAFLCASYTAGQGREVKRWPNLERLYLFAISPYKT